MRIAIAGGGVVGAMIAYELSGNLDWQITLIDSPLDSQSAGLTLPADRPTSTGAALGVLMGIISKKTKGRAWNLRRHSIQRYPYLIQELETLLDRPIPHNPNGILKLAFNEADRPGWEALAELRKTQGFSLELLSPSAVLDRFPSVNLAAMDGVAFGVFSPQDWQVQPLALTIALREAAVKRGATIAPVQVTGAVTTGDRVVSLTTTAGELACDRLVVAAGLGSADLARAIAPDWDRPLRLQPVLGQAQRLRLPCPLSDRPEPVLTGNDIHIVPLGGGDYWVGATVEFPAGVEPPIADGAKWAAAWQGAIELVPALAQAEIVETWSGLRPRPVERSAPVIEPLNANSWLATGHYRNGVLLAPATAQLISAMLTSSPA
ncbi:MAG: FAD-binding oxidoreductase [Oscillatoriales cyanobacterium]|nr:MAG: FAD-binding oxidoreductase [Oscillatoriales cyanobacterium]